jgi:hypothetical protein
MTIEPMAPDGKPVRLGYMGCGFMAQKVHLPNFLAASLMHACALLHRIPWVLELSESQQEPPMRAEGSSHNLPAQASSFIGREHELGEIHQRFPKHRLITLTGTGGTGKTRLALEAAASAIDQFIDGVWLVELAGLPTPDLMAQMIAKVFALPPVAVLAPIEQLGAFLQPKQLLLVLDNCEHLIQEAAQIAAFLLAHCPRLTLLATSREPLAISGEVVLRVRH